MRIEIICTGDEILTGKTINTNFSHISRKLEEFGLSVRWGTTVGDDQETLLEAFRLAAGRADTVIVNGGLGPTVDDLSQEVAAEAAGTSLIMNEDWLQKIEERFRSFGMAMQPNNRKQALLPATAELIDNPIGTACGFELTIGQARFYFTPGVPRELYLMLDEQIIPKLLVRNGTPTSVLVKRFHTFGLGESHIDAMLVGVEDLDRSVKLGFQTHFPEIETKLTLRGADPAELHQRVEPIAAELRRRVGNFIVAEDDETVEGIVLNTLAQRNASLAVAETFSCGFIALRLSQVAVSETAFRRGLVAPSGSSLEQTLGLVEGTLSSKSLSDDGATEAARALLRVSGTTHALVALAEQGDDTPNAPPTFCFVIAAGDEIHIRRNRLRFGDLDMLREGAAEMALDSLRRFLQGLPIAEAIDFEKR